ncbi:MAG: putative HAF family extracellular repeat protein [Planctomycetota bacterium]|jgi:probable HAF family extracellular repeat protein
MSRAATITHAFLLTALAPSTWSQTTYQYTDLGTLGGIDSAALGLNDQGQVVGWSAIAGCMTSQGLPCRHAFLFENGTMTDIGVLPGDEDSVARTINNAGTIVGTSEANIIFGSGTFHAAIWNAGVISPLPDLGSGMSWANDINEAGVISGWAPDPSVSRDRAVTWTGGAISNVGESDAHTYNRGYGINALGSLVGFAWDLFSPNDSILFEGGSWLTIGGAGQFQNSEAFDINDNNVVVGKQAFPSGSWHPAIWLTPGGQATDLGLLPGFDLGQLSGINESGHAVGRVYTDSNPEISHAVYYDGVQLIDLNTLLPAGVNALLADATEINEDGDIVGRAVVGGAWHAFLLEVDSAGGNYCTPTVNSTGSAAGMSSTGSTSIASNSFGLRAEPTPNDAFLFFYGQTQVQVPFGNGARCVGGNPTRLGAPQFSTGNVAERTVDLVAEGFAPGSMNFQCWFRDPTGGGSGFNLSDGFEVVFLP